MDRLVSLSVGTADPEDFFRTFQDLSELARNLGVDHRYVSVSSNVVDEDLHEEPAGEDLYHDENTRRKVRDALRRSIMGLTDESAQGIINELQNAGILFRERMPS